MREDPVPHHGVRRSADRTAARVAGAFALFGMAWVVLADLVYLGVLRHDWMDVWPRSINRTAFVLASAAVVFLLVRRYAGQRERAVASAGETELALRRSESRYRSLIERVPGVVWLCEVDRDDPDRTRCVYIAPQLEDLLGRTPQEWMADEDLWLRVIHPEDRPAVSEVNARAAETGTLSMEYRALHRDGDVVWIHDEAVLVPGDGDRPPFWQGVMVDITAQRVQDRALHELTESLRGVFTASPLAIVVLEPDGRVRHWNPAAERMFGWSSLEVTGASLPWVPADRTEESEENRRRTLAGESVAGLETDRVRKDGSVVRVSLSTAPLLGPEGRVTGLLGVVEDVTDRRLVEEERRTALGRQMRLARRLELLHEVDREVLSTATIGEMAGRILDHLRPLVPYDRGTVGLLDPDTGSSTYIGVRHSRVMGPVSVDGATTPAAVDPALAAQEVVVLPDLEHAHPDSPYLATARELGLRSLISIALRIEGDRVGSLVLASLAANAFDDEAVDIAKEVGSELAIAIGQAQLRQALADRAEELERLAEERRQMLQRIVRAQEEERERVALELHDGLGQVLTSISLFASDLASDLTEEIGDAARARAERIDHLIRRAIADSRRLVWSLRPPELERLGLVPALRRLADEVSLPDLTVDLHEQIGDARLPPESEAVVYRVVQEAVHNAQKHARASAISILLQRHDGQLTTLVEDNGHGFDPTSIPPGRGLGLIGMRERAHLVDGALVVESSDDAGTRVRLMVPIGAGDGATS